MLLPEIKLSNDYAAILRDKIKSRDLTRWRLALWDSIRLVKRVRS